MCRYFFSCVRPSWYGWPRYLHLLYFYAIFHILCFLAELEHLSQKRIFPKIRSLSRAEASVILFPLRKLRSTRITDLVFTSAKRLSSSIPLTLHSGHKLLTLQYSAVFAPLMILIPTRRTVNGHQFASHPYPAVFAALTRRRK